MPAADAATDWTADAAPPSCKINPGGNPVTDVPGETPRFPVTVETPADVTATPASRGGVRVGGGVSD
jgi:hypothetical protein